MTDRTPLNVYDDNADHDDLGDYVDQEEVDTSGPLTGGLIGAGLAILSTLILIGLTATILWRDSSSITISHLVMVILGLLIAVAGFFFLLRWKSHVEKGTNLNWLVYGIIFTLVVLMACYCFASALYYYMYRPFHYTKLMSYGTTEWNDAFSDQWKPQEGWDEDRMIIWWATFFTILAGLGFLILAVSLWIAAANKMPLAKMMLAVACFAGILLALFAIDYLWTTSNVFKSSNTGSSSNMFLLALGILLIIGIVLLLANLVINLLKKKGMYFFFGFVLVFFLIIFLVLLGLVLRSFRQQQFQNLNGTKSCSASLGAINETSVKTFCSAGKYLPAGSQCTKDFMVRRWEDNKNEIRFLNPKCCNAQSTHQSWSLYIFAALSLLLLTALMAAIIANFYLGDTRDYLSDFDKSRGIIELVMLGLAILALIIFAFWFGFRPADAVYSKNPLLGTTDVLGKSTDGNFKVVDLNKVYKGKVPASAGSSSVPTLARNTNDLNSNLKSQNQILKLVQTKTCTDKCGARIAILATNATIIKDNSLPIYGNSNTRSVFFDDKSTNSDYTLVYGKETDLSSWLAGLQLQPIDMTKKTQLFMRAQEIADISTLSSSGLKAGEAGSLFNLSSGGNVFNGVGYTPQDENKICQITNSCVSTQSCDFNKGTDCKRAFNFYNNGGAVKLLIPYKVKDSNGALTPYDAKATVSASYNYENNTYVQNSSSFNNGVLEFTVPKPYRQDYDFKVSLTDNDGRFIKDTQIVTVPVNSPSPIQTNEVVLLTPNGKSCIGVANSADCFRKQNLLKTDIEVTLKADDNQNLIQGATVQLFEDGSFSGNPIASATTDASGNVVFPNMAYDRYWVRYGGSQTFLANSEVVELQSVEKQDLILMLHRVSSRSAVLSEYMKSNENRDLAVNVSNLDNTKSCTVDVTNKYCAYMNFQDDVDGANSGYERIFIDKFTESYYLAYKKPTPPYSTQCTAFSNSTMKYYPIDKTTVRSLETRFNWENIRMTATVNYDTLYCFNGWGLNSKKTLTKRLTAEPSAFTECPSFYPAGTELSLERLTTLNQQ